MCACVFVFAFVLLLCGVGQGQVTFRAMVRSECHLESQVKLTIDHLKIHKIHLTLTLILRTVVAWCDMEWVGGGGSGGCGGGGSGVVVVVVGGQRIVRTL